MQYKRHARTTGYNCNNAGRVGMRPRPVHSTVNRASTRCTSTTNTTSQLQHPRTIAVAVVAHATGVRRRDHTIPTKQASDHAVSASNVKA